MSKLDYALLIITALVAISGYIEGFVLGACATLGLLAGAAVGVWGVPRILDNFSPSVSVSFAALVLVVILASIGRTIGAVHRAIVTVQDCVLGRTIAGHIL